MGIMEVVKRLIGWVIGSDDVEDDAEMETVAPRDYEDTVERTFTQKKSVEIRRYVEQVVDGSHYKGHLKIDDVALDYELVFTVPILRLNDMAPAGTVTALRRVIQLTMQRNGANIELMDEEYNFFFQLVVMYAVDFYDMPQTRANNKNLQGRGSVVAMTGGEAYIAITDKATYDLEPGFCEMLSAPKFGCDLSD